MTVSWLKDYKDDKYIEIMPAKEDWEEPRRTEKNWGERKRTKNWEELAKNEKLSRSRTEKNWVTV